MTSPQPAAPGGLAGHGSIVLAADDCTSCMLCVKECPDWCITIESHTVEVSDEEARSPGQRAGQRARTVAVLDRFAIDWGLCMYCGICVEVCPFDALAWVPAAPRAGAVAELFPPSASAE